MTSGDHPNNSIIELGPNFGETCNPSNNDRPSAKSDVKNSLRVNNEVNKYIKLTN